MARYGRPLNLNILEHVQTSVDSGGPSRNRRAFEGRTLAGHSRMAHARAKD